MTLAAVKPMAMRDALLSRIRDAMADDPTIFFVTADFGSPVIDDISTRFADRFVNVGVAEQNLINVSAGLALEGYNVFAYAIAPFITMRCLEQIRVNLCLLSQVRSMSVTLIGVGAGYSYVVSGPTHQCYEDISIMRSLPVVGLYSPSDHLEAAATFDACREPGIRYLRLDAQVLPPLDENGAAWRADGFRLLRDGAAASSGGKTVALVASGYMTHTALAVADALAQRGVGAVLVDLVDITGVDRDALARKLAGVDLIVSMEEGFAGRGGVDAVIGGLIREAAIETRFLPIGVPPEYSFELGTRVELHDRIGIGADACLRRILELL
ncbi:transketolase family protein [Stappia sp.]|uniref:transketolase family protein n=1 Tax=Stappia sp. TaxID=1870903 RepID=UPI003A991EB7